MKRWALAVTAGLATFCACWWGLKAGAGWQQGDALGLAAVPFTVVFGVASFWAGQQRDSGSSETSATAQTSVAVSSVVQVVDHPTGPVFAGDYRGARIRFGPSRKSMILAVVAILAVDAAAISAWAAVSAGPSPVGGSGVVAGQEAGLSVPRPPWVTDSTGVLATLTRGDRIRYAFYVDNSTGKAISANVRFDAYWGTKDERPVNIFNVLFQQYLPPGRTTVYSPSTRIPGDALPGMYTEQAAGGRGERNYTAHWLVVVGFGLGSSNQSEVLVNDPDGTRGYGGIKGQPVALETFGKAVIDASSLASVQQEPQRIFGIVVTVR